MASSQTIRIETTSPSHGGLMFLPRAWIKQLDLVSNGRYLLAFGAKQVSVVVREQTVRAGQDVAHVTPLIAQSLLLPKSSWLPLFRSGNVLRLGYVFGILADVKTDGDQVIGQQNSVFQILLEEAASKGMYGYVFSPLDLDWENLCVTGYRRLGHNRWSKEQVPFPDVVYDQIISRTFENRADVAPERERLYKLLAPRYFNPGYFDKWQVHEWLSKNVRTASYVPNTICFRSVEQTAEFLYRYSDVYMKPVHGSLGIGILRVRRQPDGRVFYQLKKKDGSLNQKHAGSISVFLKEYQRRLLRGPYIIQEALRLRTWQGRPFDIRLVLQKDETGHWQRTKMFCRIAQEGQITSNLSTGGDAISAKQLLSEILQNDKNVSRVMKELRQIGDLIPGVIEQEHGGTIGELGLDLGLDESGRIWVIEVNAKPWKKPNIAEGEWKNLALLAFQRPVQFATYLCQKHLDG
ncbi:MAG: YheC/YheD family endospore coat-associated protein [Tumebacillaceae bacterium]